LENHIRRSILIAVRDLATWDEAWLGPDGGLVTCWEVGRLKSKEDPSMAMRAKSGELLPLPWEGGFHAALKKEKNYGTYNYLAMWQGLREEDLDIEIGKTYTITCSKHGKPVIFDGNSFLKEKFDKKSGKREV
jgi:hypothetical protein